MRPEAPFLSCSCIPRRSSRLRRPAPVANHLSSRGDRRALQCQPTLGARSDVLRSPRSPFDAEAPPLEPGRRAPESPRDRSHGASRDARLAHRLTEHHPSAERDPRAVPEPKLERDPFHPPRHPSSSSRDLPGMGRSQASTRRPRPHDAPRDDDLPDAFHHLARRAGALRAPSSDEPARTRGRQTPKRLFDSHTEDP